MAKETVFCFEYLDRESRSFKRSDDMATEKAINEMGGVILRETATSVDCELVTFSGLVRKTPLPK